ncbi:MAG: RNA polymerase sigma factor [Flavobacteriales bacterium]|jgi:RNA polymerase sigma-70 factor (ECF subfamily)|nr:RNA polymerase sigma factor [Flavobacteriales bacterium]
MGKRKQAKFLKLYEPVHDSFERFCRARVYGEMEYTDLMNETLLIAYEKLDSLRSEKAFLSFLFSISVRLLANDNRKLKAEKTQISEVNLVDAQTQSPEQAAEVHLLHRALSCLPEEQKESIILFEISGFSIKEIAQIQNASESAVKQRLRRGRLKLTEILTFESPQNAERSSL